MPTRRKGRTWSHELEVIGLRFRWKRQGREAIQRMLDKKEIAGILLIREPNNPHDPNAIMVCLPSRVIEGKQLGYLHRETAELLAPKLDAGTLEVVSATLYELDAKTDYNSGLMIVRFRDLPAKPRKKAAKRKTAKDLTRK